MEMQKTIPDFLMGENGERVTAEGWEAQRQYLLRLLLEKEYGAVPPPPDACEFTSTQRREDTCAGKAVYEELRARVRVGGKEFSFPFFAVVPRGIKKPPAFLHINFRNNVPDEYMPTEEIVDGGFAVFSFGYNDVTKDNGDFSDGLAGLFPKGSGKIALWAWAAMRVMDHICGRNDVDTGSVAVVGHSRLGKTALLAGAADTRFRFVISNDSGCSGAAVSRGKAGERVADITRQFPYWFCESYGDYAGREEDMPFDQHFLLALTAPRYLCVASARDDQWADPQSERLGCVLASRAWELLGVPGYEPGGRIKYYAREGTHWLSRYDWRKFMEFVAENTPGLTSSGPYKRVYPNQ